MCSVCLCVRINAHTPTLPPALKIEMTKTKPLSLLLSKITPHAKQQVPSQTSSTPPPSFPNAEWTNCTYMNARAHPVASVYANVYADFHNTGLSYTPAYVWCSQHLLKCMHTLRKKCKCTCACAPMQQCRNFFVVEAIVNLLWVLRKHHAGFCLPPALLLSGRNQLCDAVRSRNPSKSTLAHDVVVAAVSHKHHSIISVGAGLIQFVYGLHSKCDHGAHPSQKSISIIFFASFHSKATADRKGIVFSAVSDISLSADRSSREIKLIGGGR